MFELKRISQLIVKRKGKFKLRHVCNENALRTFLAEFAAEDLLYTICIGPCMFSVPIVIDLRLTASK